MDKRKLLAAPLLIATGLALGACSSSYENNVMFARIDRSLTKDDVARERQAQTTELRSNALYGYYSDQDLRLNSYALFSCANTPTGYGTPSTLTDAVLVPPGLPVQTSDIVAIEIGGGQQREGGTHPHRILEVFTDKAASNLAAEKVGDIMLVRCNQNAYDYGRHHGYPARAEQYNRYGER